MRLDYSASVDRGLYGELLEDLQGCREQPSPCVCRHVTACRVFLFFFVVAPRFYLGKRDESTQLTGCQLSAPLHIVDRLSAFS